MISDDPDAQIEPTNSAEEQDTEERYYTGGKGQ